MHSGKNFPLWLLQGFSVHLDKILAIMGLFLGIFISLMPILRSESGSISVTFGIALFLLCAVYLGLRLGKRPLEVPRLEAGRSAYLIINILFFSIFAYSLLSLYLRSDPYVRPTGYFVSLFVLIGLLVVEILFLPDKKSYVPLVLLKIILIPLSIEWSQMLFFPTVINADSAFHQSFTQEMLATGTIPKGWGYFHFPVMHLVNGIASSITGLSYKMAGVFFTSFMQITCILLSVFLLGKLIFEDRVGLLAALLLGTVSCFIYRSYWVLPYSFGAVFISLFIYLLFKREQSHHAAMVTLLSFLLIAVSIFSHQLIALWMIILLIAFWVGARIIDKMGRGQENLPVVTLNIVLLSTIGMFAWWMYVTGDLISMLGLMKQNFSMGTMNQLQVVIPEAEPYTYEIPEGILFFNNIGKLLVCAIAVIGCFYMVSYKSRNPYTFNLAVGGIVLLGIVFFGVINYGTYDILFYRWEYYSHILLSVPLAVSFYLLSAMVRSKFIKVPLLTSVVIILSFLIIMNTRGNMDRPLFPDMSNPRQAYTVSEMQAVETILEVSDGDIVLDGTAAAMIPFRQSLHRIISIEGNRAFFTKDFSEYRYAVIVIREEFVRKAMPLLNATIKLDYNINQLLAEEGFSRIYTVGPVSAFLDNSNR